jgi:hypothetical protein
MPLSCYREYALKSSITHLIINDQRATLHLVATIAMLALSGAITLRLDHLLHVGPHVQSAQQRHGLLGFRQRLHLVRQHKRNLVDALFNTYEHLCGHALE